MPVTLAEAALNAVDDVDVAVIDEFRKESWLIDNMVFDDVINPAGGGNTMTCGYQRLVTQPKAGFRKINTEYVPHEVVSKRYTVDLKVLGGSYEIDRVSAKVGPAASGQVALQTAQKVKATKAQFADAVINGDESVDEDSFDGLSKALAGSSTEMTATGAGADWSAVEDRLSGIKALRLVRQLVRKLDGRPTALLMNSDTLTAFETIAEMVSQLTTLEAFGQTVTAWRGIPLIDLGDKSGSSDPVIPTSTATATEGQSDIYAVRIGMDGFHGVSTVGGQLVTQYLPDFSTPKAVKLGEVEMGPLAVVLKSTKAAGVIRGLKVA